MLQILLEEVGELDKVFAPLLGRHFAPFWIGLLCGGDGNVDVFLGRFMYGYDGLFICGVDGFEGFAFGAFDEFVVDETVGSRY